MPGADLPSPGDERDALIGAARAAGHAILPMFRNVATKAWHKADLTPVSDADLRANHVLKEALLHGQRAGYGWLSEENADDPARLEKKRTLIVDPIDGTRAFLRGEDEFTVCLAVIENGETLASVIYAPARDELYAAARGAGTTLNGQRIIASGASQVENARIIGAPRMFTHPGWPTPWPRMQVAYKNSTSYRMALVAAGRFDGTLALAPKADWDTAPGTLIAQEAGATVSDHQGQRFTFGKADPRQAALVCAAPQLYPALLSRLSHLPKDLGNIQP